MGDIICINMYVCMYVRIISTYYSIMYVYEYIATHNYFQISSWGKDVPMSWWILEISVHNPTEEAIDETHQF